MVQRASSDDCRVRRNQYVKPAIAIILMVAGGKKLLHEVWEVPTWASASIVGAILAVGIGASLLSREGKREKSRSSRQRGAA